MVGLRTALLAGVFMAAASVGIAHADSIAFTSNAGSTASPLSFTVGGGTGSLSGYEYSAVHISGFTYTSQMLYQKNTGADEMGIGINGDLDNEISNSRANGNPGEPTASSSSTSARPGRPAHRCRERHARPLVQLRAEPGCRRGLLIDPRDKFHLRLRTSVRT